MIELTKASINETRSVDQKLEKEKLGPTIQEVKDNIKALRTQEKSPKVKQVIGNENKPKTGRINELRIDRTTLATMAIPKLDTWKPE